MDKRIALSQGYPLIVKNSNDAEIIYTIKSELARGGSCIVYEGVYLNNAGDEKKVRIKECYPYKLDIARDENDKLIVKDEDSSLFNQYIQRIRNSFDVMNKLFDDKLLTNSTSNLYDIYEKNNTVYVVSVYVEGKTLSDENDFNLRNTISIVKSVAKVIKEIHRNGYLYLDIKPDNIWVLEGTTELIQLFDFDSILPMSVCEESRYIDNYRISYTKGFAAYELQMGNLHKIGKYTDVYGIGALLFYMLFHHVPNTFERDLYAEYDYGSWKYKDKCFRDKLYFKMTEFFHHTLSDYYADRYDTVEEVLESLEELCQLADEKQVFIYSSNLSYDKEVIGRDAELEKLYAWYKDGSNTMLFVTGFGGIGKSSIVKVFLNKHKKEFDNYVYMNFKDNIRKTIIDTQLFINTIEKINEETERDFFDRKIQALREVAQKEKVLLVIDNYSDTDNEDLTALINTNCKLIFITRKERVYGNNELNVRAITDNETTYKLFHYYLGRPISEREKVCVDEIVDSIAGHTLVLELIAKQILSSHLSIDEAMELTKEKGFTSIGEEKIRHSGKYDIISNIIDAIFDSSGMSEEHRAILKAVALFGTTGIHIKKFAKMAELPNLDSINELNYESWLEVRNDIISIHPVISQVVYNWEANESIDRIAVNVMSHVYKIIRLENHREDYPKKLVDVQLIMHDTYSKNKFLKKMYDKKIGNQGILGEIVSERINRGGEYVVSDRHLLMEYLGYAETILSEARKNDSLHKRNLYKDLLYDTLIATPRDREDFVLKWSDESVNDKDISNSITMMKLYDYRVSIYCERKDFDAAWNEIGRAKEFLNRNRCNLSIGQYYNILAEYYDSLLDGAYEAYTDKEVEYLNALIDSLDKAIKYTKRSTDRLRKPLHLIDYLLSKVNVLIRCGGEDKEIEKILGDLKKLIVTNCQENSKFEKNYYMTNALYATYILGDYEKMMKNVILADRISSKTSTSDLQVIDEIYVPCADMLCVFEKYDSALIWLDCSIKLCESKLNIPQYVRKKLELHSHKVDVYDIMEDYTKCKEEIILIDELNEKYKEQGIYIDILDEIKERVLVHTKKTE